MLRPLHILIIKMTSIKLSTTSERILKNVGKYKNYKENRNANNIPAGNSFKYLTRLKKQY